MGRDGPPAGRPSEESDVTPSTDRPSLRRLPVWSAALVVVGLVLTLLTGSTGTSPSRTVLGAVADATCSEQRMAEPRVPVGVSPGFVVVDLPADELRADLRKIRCLGARWVRVDLSWARIAPSPSRREWGDTDRLLDAARDAGLEVLAVAGFRPEWARGADGSAAPAGFGRFVAEAARRYRSQVDAWEIWNEPNLRRSWGARPDPAAYARLVAPAARAVRTHDAGSTVLLGAMAPATDAADGSETSPLTFLRGVYRAGIDRSLFDAVSVHPYSYPALPSGDEDWNTFNRLPDLHALMARQGDGDKDLWITEYGAPTGRSDRAVSSERQAQMVVDAYREAARLPYVGALFVYSLRDTSTDTTDPEAAFGLLGHSGRAKPAYEALRRELQRS